MKTIASWIVLFIVSSNICDAQARTPITIGTIDSIYSHVLKESRTIWVYLPSTADVSIATKLGLQKYPVIYLLDGDAYFHSVAGMIQQLSQFFPGKLVCPEMIVVGIPNTDRLRDLSPTYVPNNRLGYDSVSVLTTTGGGEAFMRFVEKELIPHVDSLYPTSTYRMFIGHSLGGLTVMNALVHHTNVFDSYVAIDPSMWWDSTKLLKEAYGVFRERQFVKKTLYLAIANTVVSGLDTAQVRGDANPSTSHIRSILLLGDALRQNRNNGLKWQVKYYAEDDHGSVPLIAAYDALRFVFSEYRMPNLLLKDLYDTTFNAYSAVIANFKRVSEEMGYEVHPPEDLMNWLGYSLVARKEFAKAYSCFEMNIKYYPNSLNVFDSMGDYYVAIGDKQKAIECFTKAYSVNKWKATKEKLERLRSVE